MLHNVLRDLRYAIRSLSRTPGFTAAAVVTIALGVGINTGIFSVINGVLFRDIPAPDAHELVSVHQSFEDLNREGRVGAVTTAEYEAYRDGSNTLSGLLGHSDPVSATLGGDAQTQTGGLLVTCNYFDVLEQRPVVGRALTATDCEQGTDPVVVLGYELWTTTFSADPAIVGSTIELDERLFTVVGVAREGTYGGRFRAGFFAPISAEPLLSGNGRYSDPRSSWLTLIGRGDDSSGSAQVRAELDVIAAQIDHEQPAGTRQITVERARPETIPTWVRDTATRGAAVIMAAFGLILLIACANVGNLMLARGTGRSREFAVRLALGATRAHLIRQLLVESVLLSIIGGALGSLLAFWSFQALLALAMPMILPVGVPLLAIDASPDTHVLGVTLALALGSGVVFGLAPALHASRTDLHSAMKQDSAGGGGSRSAGRLQAVLLGAQVALCMVLIIGAGLLLRGLHAAQTIDPGFDARGVAVLTYDYVDDTGRGDDPEFWRRLRAEVGALPNVEATAFASRVPLGDDFGFTRIRLPGQAETELKSAVPNFVGPDYFSVVGIRIVRGRTFTNAELEGDARAAIVSESTARNLWGAENPIGRALSWRASDDEDVTLHVVGVAEDAQVSALGRVDPYYVYLPTRSSMKLLAKSRVDFAATASGIRDVVRTLDPGLPAPVQPLEANLDRARNISGLLTTLAAVLGGLALVLAAVGIYGVVSYFVGRRFREIGIRLAMGAGIASIYELVLRRTMRPVVIGAVLGIVGAVAVSGVLSRVLYGVSPLDPLGLGGAAVFVLGIALAVGIRAARRAARVDPVLTLRHE